MPNGWEKRDRIVVNLVGGLTTREPRTMTSHSAICGRTCSPIRKQARARSTSLEQTTTHCCIAPACPGHSQTLRLSFHFKISTRKDTLGFHELVLIDLADVPVEGHNRFLRVEKIL